jgi:hypothetical protein
MLSDFYLIEIEMQYNELYDWTGCVIAIPNQHHIIITKQWKKDRSDMWWWKCRDCTKSSGVLSAAQIEKFEKQGLVFQSNGALPNEYSGHPKEQDNSDDDLYYGYMF